MVNGRWDHLLSPSLVLGGTILALTPEVVKTHHLQGLILDVDETLVPLKQRQVSPEVADWIEEIRQHVALWLVSNNLSESRIGGIAEALNLPYILGARKPSRRKLRQAMEAMQLPPEAVAMVGDRLFTDALAGNRLGLFTILVEPMVDPLIAARSYPIRNFEVWLTQKLGVTLYKH
ncbi:YqeG family HAD IIIA-type phosphatase [Spirulina major CS-329]|uniref:YqeG family HAD IIIA-type phosphatase n=1 Tax=Spirulina TaxID=1154 RepID=UPI0023310DEB|nr:MULTISPECIES: YqeG family HAD IIIA-type phosphatase [Spirulina]MDB9496100.1 YqeG family HAD IIIA-type phosphatase [Spirulina subsalsa CS-330]MDB9503110.1 YqeG family HAD IIIA-type phosphatase [Spirulina major CS-329]